MASERLNLLVTSPQHLIFSAPYNRIQRHDLTLINPSSMVLLFKLKTNSVQDYRVHPIAGQVQPYGSYRVIITLSCFEFQPNVCYRHRFKVESIYRPVDGLCQDESPLSVFRRTPRSDICVVRLPVRLEPVPLTTSQLNLATNVNRKDKEIGRVQKLSDILPESVDQEPMLKKKLQRKKKREEEKHPDLEFIQQKPQESDQKQRVWLLVIILILGFIVGGYLFRFLQTLIPIIMKSIQNNVKFSNFEQLSSYLNISNYEKYWTYWKISFVNLLKYEKLVDYKNILNVDLLGYLKSCCYEKVLKYVDLNNLLTLGAPHKNTFLHGQYESMLNCSYVGKI